jgi:hypothetical protein
MYVNSCRPRGSALFQVLSRAKIKIKNRTSKPNESKRGKQREGETAKHVSKQERDREKQRVCRLSDVVRCVMGWGRCGKTSKEGVINKRAN